MLRFRKSHGLFILMYNIFRVDLVPLVHEECTQTPCKISSKPLAIWAFLQKNLGPENFVCRLTADGVSGLGGGGGVGSRAPTPKIQNSEFSIETVKTSWYNFYLCSWGASARTVPSDRHEQGVVTCANDVSRGTRTWVQRGKQSGKIQRENTEQENRQT